MKTEKELFDYLEDERRKYALVFSVDYRRYLQRRMPKLLTMMMPLLLVGFIALLLVQHNRIESLQETNDDLQKRVDALNGQSDWYKAAYQQSMGEPQGRPPTNTTRPTVKRTGGDAFSLTYWQAS